jgi:hypothetical protein
VLLFPNELIVAAEQFVTHFVSINAKKLPAGQLVHEFGSPFMQL